MLHCRHGGRLSGSEKRLGGFDLMWNLIDMEAGRLSGSEKS